MDAVTIRDEHGIVATTEFTSVCPDCGGPVEYSRGVRLPHDCADLEERLTDD